ncbi:hypothetical protein [Acidocella sp.]|uniref:hypothetical protein n=1 Tax=Acidocella sp. TaxID=50710 RepID=UPI0018500DDC|nr:hypothetical protein [Acidocella sp.]NNM56814.1 hypothetical protein [Acidocella sp.]
MRQTSDFISRFCNGTLHNMLHNTRELRFTARQPGNGARGRRRVGLFKYLCCMVSVVKCICGVAAPGGPSRRLIKKYRWMFVLR